VADEEMEVNPEFKKVYSDLVEFRKNFAVWGKNGYLK
jgi:hypothetical protein